MPKFCRSFFHPFNLYFKLELTTADLFVFGENAMAKSSSARANVNKPATSISKQINVINYLRFVSQMALRAGGKRRKRNRRGFHLMLFSCLPNSAPRGFFYFICELLSLTCTSHDRKTSAVFTLAFDTLCEN